MAGRTIRVDPDRGTVQIPGVYDNTKKAKRSKNEDSDRPAKQQSQQAKTDPQAQPAPPALRRPPSKLPRPLQPAPAAARSATGTSAFDRALDRNGCRGAG